MKNTLILPLLMVSAVSHAYATSVDPRTLCTNESEKHLAKLQKQGETRFSEFQFDPDSAKSTDAEFTDLGETGGRRHHRKKNQTPATQEFGQMLVMKAYGKEKAGWRNLVLKCGVNKGKIATFTYEILNISDKAPANATSTASAAPVPAAAVAAPSTTTASAPVVTANTPGTNDATTAAPQRDASTQQQNP